MHTPEIPKKLSDSKRLELMQLLCDLINESPGRMTGYDCPECRNKGYIYVQQGWDRVLRPCRCMPVRDSIRRMKRSGLYERINTQTFDTFRADTPWQQNMLTAAKRFAKTREMHAFFIGGQQGCGKTHLCTAICGALLTQGMEVRYVVWETQIKDILTRSGISDRDEREALLQPLYHSKIVYLDDFLRKDIPTQAERSVAFDVINRRYIENRITIVSSEHPMDDLMHIDQAVASRIKEMCGSTFCLNISADRNKNYRLQKSRDSVPHNSKRITLNS